MSEEPTGPEELRDPDRVDRPAAASTPAVDRDPDELRDPDRVDTAPVETDGDAPAGDAAAAPESTLPATARNTVTVKLARFEGPLDLLLHLIKRDEIEITDIPISHITQQYLAYIELMRALDLDVAGEFLVMAATLMRIKAKMLLPLPAVGEEEEEGDPREELVQRLVEYRQFKEASGVLKMREEDRRVLFERGMLPGDDEMGPLPLAPATLFDLLDALNRVMSRIPAPVVYEVQGELYGVDDKMSLIASTVAENGSVSFTELLLRCRVRAEMVVTFMALLELIKMGTVLVVQTENFGDITILARTSEGSETDATVEPASGA